MHGLVWVMISRRCGGVALFEVMYDIWKNVVLSLLLNSRLDLIPM
jgi:hypothetical protein